MNRAASFLLCALVVGTLSARFAWAQMDQQTPTWKTEENRRKMEELGSQSGSGPSKIPKEVKVSVDASKARAIMMPWTLGVHTLASDAHLTDPDVIPLLRSSQITTLRYPGGRIADTFHWSTYNPSNWQGLDHPNVGYSPASNLGSFMRFMEQVGTAIFTVNYGTNLNGSGGGEPAEAAAWVAYANGNPTDTKVIGKDSAGNDWQTVGYWATLRASAPLSTDDGKNFLRIQHPAPFGIRFWEIGNQVFQNGYYGGEGLEEDLHAPYPKNPKDNEKGRKKNPNLSPAAYAKNYLQFAQAMKAVDPRINLGIPLDPTLAGQINRQEWTKDPITGKYVQESSVNVDKDFGIGADWAKGVLAPTCNDVDFVTLHWYAGDTTQESGWKNLDNYKLLMAPQDSLRQILTAVGGMIQNLCGQRARNIHVAFTEIAPIPYAKVTDEVVPGLFAADLYLSLVEYGVINANFSELHSGGFLDDQNKPGPSYFGVQMVHALLNFNDAVLTASSSSSMLSVHAAKRADGSLSVMLINKDAKNPTTVKISVGGASLGTNGARFDYGQSNPPDGNSVVGKPMTGLGTSFSVPMPPYTATVIVIPKT